MCPGCGLASVATSTLAASCAAIDATAATAHPTIRAVDGSTACATTAVAALTAAACASAIATNAIATIATASLGASDADAVGACIAFATSARNDAASAAPSADRRTTTADLTGSSHSTFRCWWFGSKHMGHSRWG